MRRPSHPARPGGWDLIPSSALLQVLAPQPNRLASCGSIELISILFILGGEAVDTAPRGPVDIGGVSHAASTACYILTHGESAVNEGSFRKDHRRRNLLLRGAALGAAKVRSGSNPPVPE